MYAELDRMAIAPPVPTIPQVTYRAESHAQETATWSDGRFPVVILATVVCVVGRLTAVMYPCNSRIFPQAYSFRLAIVALDVSAADRAVEVMSV